MKMKTTLYMAMSLNGIIATEDGSEDFLSDENWNKFCKLANEFGNIIIGRKTYEKVKSWDYGFGYDDLVNVQKIVVSDSGDIDLPEGYTLASSPEEAIRILTNNGFQRALVTGGSSLNASFIKAEMIDEVILNIEPTLVGKGIPLFSSIDTELQLNLISQEKSESDVLTLKYKVLK